ncbi:MAG: copper chaperone PCu(A)C [Rhodobacteraceae bacterium]|nr:copper chaperone PCu(A)C [Paracoccaceae bacterium]
MPFTTSLIRRGILGTVATFALAMPALAGDITVHDPYALSSGAMAQAGAAFMQIMNEGPEDDRLIDVRSDIAKMTELHTHEIDAQGVARMMKVEEGFVIPAGGMHSLQRGGDHVMFMGLTQALEHGDSVAVTLVFEKAGEMVIDVPVDLARKPGGGMKMQHKTDN